MPAFNVNHSTGNPMQLKGKVTIITGGARGISLAYGRCYESA